MPMYAFISAPQGMTINPTSGLIEWLPDSNGDFVIDIQAENAAGSDSQKFTLVVEKPPLPTNEPTSEPEPTKSPPPSVIHFIYMPVAQK